VIIWISLLEPWNYTGIINGVWIHYFFFLHHSSLCGFDILPEIKVLLINISLSRVEDNFLNGEWSRADDTIVDSKILGAFILVIVREVCGSIGISLLSSQSAV
jgi:hypothetical protein